MNHLEPKPELYNVPWIADDFNGMPYRIVGRSGLRAASVGIGTWKFGYPDTGDEARTGEKTALEIFDRSIDLGAAFWDTANRYNNGSGNSERIIGKWFSANPEQRRNVVLATKIFGGMDGVTPNHSRLSRTNIFESAYASLERLQTDYIDLLYFHAYDKDTPVEESLTAVEDLMKMDMIRYFAVSNFSVEQMKIYDRAGDAFRFNTVAVQNQYDLLNGESLTGAGVLDYCAENNVSYIAWSPLARGLLTEKYLNPSISKKGDRLFDEGTLQKDADPETLSKLIKLTGYAGKWDMKLNELAIAYMLTQPGMGPVIPSVSSVKQLESNARGGKIVLEKDQVEVLKKVFEG